MENGERNKKASHNIAADNKLFRQLWNFMQSVVLHKTLHYGGVDLTRKFKCLTFKFYLEARQQG
nr:hypothetical protein Clen_178 [Cedratvirus lena]